MNEMNELESYEDERMVLFTELRIVAAKYGIEHYYYWIREEVPEPVLGPMGVTSDAAASVSCGDRSCLLRLIDTVIWQLIEEYEKEDNSDAVQSLHGMSKAVDELVEELKTNLQ